MPKRQRHTTTRQTATREHLHVADLPLQPWEGWAYVLRCCAPGTGPVGPNEAGFPQHSTMAGRAGQLGMTPRKTHKHTSQKIHCNHGCLATQTRMDQFNFGCSWGNWREGEDASNGAGKQANVGTTPKIRPTISTWIHEDRKQHDGPSRCAAELSH